MQDLGVYPVGHEAAGIRAVAEHVDTRPMDALDALQVGRKRPRLVQPPHRPEGLDCRELPHYAEEGDRIDNGEVEVAREAFKQKVVVPDRSVDDDDDTRPHDLLAQRPVLRRDDHREPPCLLHDPRRVEQHSWRAGQRELVRDEQHVRTANRPVRIGVLGMDAVGKLEFAVQHPLHGCREIRVARHVSAPTAEYEHVGLVFVPLRAPGMVTDMPQPCVGRIHASVARLYQLVAEVHVGMPVRRIDGVEGPDLPEHILPQRAASARENRDVPDVVVHRQEPIGPVARHMVVWRAAQARRPRDHASILDRVVLVQQLRRGPPTPGTQRYSISRSIQSCCNGNTSSL